jgi:hypothetical protein
MYTSSHRCHCGAEFGDSDHCPVCFCEEYEGTCDHRVDDQEVRDADAVDAERVVR